MAFQRRSERYGPMRIQRCVFHAFSQVKRYTTSNPHAGGQSYCGLAKALLGITGPLKRRRGWVGERVAWSEVGRLLIGEDGDGGGGASSRMNASSRRGDPARLINAGTLFTYLDPRLDTSLPLPATNNRIGGGTNAQLRAMLRDHGFHPSSAGSRRSSGGAICSPSLARGGDPARHADRTALSKLYAKDSINRTNFYRTIPQWGDAISLVRTASLGALPYGLTIHAFCPITLKSAYLRGCHGKSPTTVCGSNMVRKSEETEGWQDPLNAGAAARAQ